MSGACAGGVAHEDLFAGGGELLLLVGAACEGGAALEGLFASWGRGALLDNGQRCLQDHVDGFSKPKGGKHTR